MRDFLNFGKMVSSVIIKILYALGLIGLTISGFVLMFIDDDTILVGIALLTFGNLFWRLLCEGMILLFSMHENLVSINHALSGTASVTTSRVSKTPPTVGQRKVLLSKVDNPNLYVNEKAFDPRTKHYIGTIVKIDVAKQKCHIKSDFGDESQKEMNEIMVNEF